MFPNYDLIFFNPLFLGYVWVVENTKEKNVKKNYFLIFEYHEKRQGEKYKGKRRRNAKRFSSSFFLKKGRECLRELNSSSV